MLASSKEGGGELQAKSAYHPCLDATLEMSSSTTSTSEKKLPVMHHFTHSHISPLSLKQEIRIWKQEGILQSIEKNLQ